MDRIIFFDIDKTIFDREGYLRGFYSLLASEYGLAEPELEEISGFYDSIKEEYGYFSNEAFLARIYEVHPEFSEKLDYYFKPENLDKYLFEDSSILFQIKDARLGIFSKGDKALQEVKINKFKNVLENDLIYIFHNKLEKVDEILEKYKDSEIILVDDNLTVLLAAKDKSQTVRTILIDRNKEQSQVNGVDFKISSLSDIIAILNEKTT